MESKNNKCFNNNKILFNLILISTIFIYILISYVHSLNISQELGTIKFLHYQFPSVTIFLYAKALSKYIYFILYLYIFYILSLIIFKDYRNVIYKLLISIIIILNLLIAIYLSQINSSSIYIFWGYIDAFLFWNIVLGIFHIFPLLLLNLYKLKNKE